MTDAAKQTDRELSNVVCCPSSSPPSTLAVIHQTDMNRPAFIVNIAENDEARRSLVYDLNKLVEGAEVVECRHGGCGEKENEVVPALEMTLYG